MSEDQYRFERLKLEHDRNKILTEISQNLTEIHNVLFDTLGSAETGKVLENLGSAVFGVTSSDFEGIEQKLEGVIGAIEEK